MSADRWRSVRATVAQRMLSRQGALSRELSAAIADQLPELRNAEPALQQAVDAMSRHVIHVTVGGLADLQPCPPPPSTSPTLAFARRMGERGFAAYRTVLIGQIAQRWLLNRLLAELERALPQPAPIDLVAPMVTWQLACFSVLGDAVGEQHLMAQEQTRAAIGGIAPEDVDFALELAEDEQQIEEILRYGLDARHLGMVVWSQHGTVRGNQLVRLVRGLGELGPVGDVLVSPRDLASVNAWVALAGPVRQAVTQIVRALGSAGAMRVGFGEPGEGLAGFRSTHYQAVAAFEVAQLPGSIAEPAVRYRDVAVTNLLRRRPGDTEPWVAAVLGELAGECEDKARLRETLRVSLEVGENASTAATRLYVHRNTVKYRVARAQDQLGVPLETNRLAVASALNYHRYAIGDK
ncbi:MAG: helix-turn-helix domain-containing protein [Propionibacteriaceae bacterium]|nr:helix-turn-helix domain-containing protein [Propionibacteriaceae bacterium]